MFLFFIVDSLPYFDVKNGEIIQTPLFFIPLDWSEQADSEMASTEGKRGDSGTHVLFCNG